MGRFASPAQRCKVAELPTAVFIGLLAVIIFVFKRLAIIGVTLAGLWIDRTEMVTSVFSVGAITTSSSDSRASRLPSGAFLNHRAVR